MSQNSDRLAHDEEANAQTIASRRIKTGEGLEHSRHLILGYAGIVSLGHAAFFGLGAYSAGLLALHGIVTEPVLALVLAGLAATVVGFITSFLVIRGVGVNNDGADKASFTAPSVRGQADAIGLALSCAGVTADSIGYVEAHGTGTHLGDPIEDLGWVCVKSWRFGSVDKPAGGFGSREELWSAYESAGGLSVDPIRAHWWEVFGTVRWGVICLTQAWRHLSGSVKSMELASIGRRAVETEVDLLQLLKGAR